MFRGVLNRFNLDTNGSFHRVAKIVVNKEKNDREKKKAALQLSRASAADLQPQSKENRWE